MTEEQRPGRRPLTEDEFREIRAMRLRQVGSLELARSYPEWLLRGRLGEPYDPEAIIGIFPTLTQEGIVFEVDGLTPQEAAMEEYYSEAARLNLPPRILALERHQYKGFAAMGDASLQSLIPFFVQSIMPSAVLVFSRPPGSAERSVYMISHTLVPPSSAFRHLQGILPGMRGNAQGQIIH